MVRFTDITKHRFPNTLFPEQDSKMCTLILSVPRHYHWVSVTVSHLLTVFPDGLGLPFRIHGHRINCIHILPTVNITISDFGQRITTDQCRQFESGLCCVLNSLLKNWTFSANGLIQIYHRNIKSEIE